MNTQTNKTEVFETTLTLRQEGRDGDVQAFLTFNPLNAEDGPSNQPEAYNRMACMMQMYLYLTGMVDERGDLIDGVADDIEVEIEPTRSIN